MDPIFRTASRLAVPAIIAVGAVQSSMYDVRGGTRAVIFDRLQGVKEGVINEGTHFLVPWLQRSIHFDVRTKPRNIATTTGSKDMQMVSLTLRVLHRPEVKALPKIYQVGFYSLCSGLSSQGDGCCEVGWQGVPQVRRSQKH
jgi:prohibitin 1